MTDGRFELQSEVNGVRIDQVRGAGNVPHNQSIDYFGFVAMMRPSAFLSLASHMAISGLSLPNLVESLRTGGAIASPFLTVDYDDDGIAHVVGHEGRNRMMAVQAAVGDVEIPVHIFPRGKRARDLDGGIVETARAGMRRQDDGELVTGPLFGDARLSGATLAPDADISLPGPRL